MYRCNRGVGDLQNGVFKVSKTKFSKTYMFYDINYLLKSDDEQEQILNVYCNMLNSLEVDFKITINNKNRNMRTMRKNTLMEMSDDSFDEYRKIYNDMIESKITEGKQCVEQQKYITISIDKKNVTEAALYFNVVETTIKRSFTELGTILIPLNANERMRILHDFYRIGNEESFHYDFDEFKEHKKDVIDYISPAMPDFWRVRRRKVHDCKDEIAKVLLTTDDVIAIDPESEQGCLCREFNGQEVIISPTTKNYINPFELHGGTVTDDDINANVRAIKNIGTEKVKSKAVQGGRKTAHSVAHLTGKGIKGTVKGGVYSVYATREGQRRELIRCMKEYIKANGTLQGSGYEDKPETLYMHERQEIDNCLRETAAKSKRQGKQAFSDNKAAFKQAKREVNNNGIIKDKELKAKADNFTRAQKQELKQVGKRQRFLSKTQNKQAEKALIKKKAVSTQIAKNAEKARSGISAIFKGLAGAVKGMAASSALPLVIAAAAIVAAVAVIIPGFIKSAEKMNTSQQIIKVAEKEIGTVGGKYRHT